LFFFGGWGYARRRTGLHLAVTIKSQTASRTHTKPEKVPTGGKENTKEGKADEEQGNVKSSKARRKG
jgi:hypothetical protein